jgi:hypothetical protein
MSEELGDKVVLSDDQWRKLLSPALKQERKHPG